MAVNTCPCTAHRRFFVPLPNCYKPSTSCSTCSPQVPSEIHVASTEPQFPDAGAVAVQQASLPNLTMPDQNPSLAVFREASNKPINSDHAKDFTWIVGKLEYLNMKNKWRVRYASCDSDDIYGGVIALGGVDHLSTSLKDGMPVRLRGQLVESESRKAAPEYFVYDIKVIVK